MRRRAPSWSAVAGAQASRNMPRARARQDCSDACPGAAIIPELNAWQGAAAPAEDADHVVCRRGTAAS
eukprot:2093126-Pyramimonas_sp.AAC.1